MEKAANQLIKITRKAHDEVPNLIINEIILKRELKDKELLKEEPELTGKRAEKRKNLANILKSINSQQKKKEPNMKEEIFIKTNGFYNCPECSFTTKWSISHLKFHISAVHRKLKPFKCSDCAKYFARRRNLYQHRLSMHNTDKKWICDSCGSRFGVKSALKDHVMSHLPPSFFCSECDKKFVRADHLKSHQKLHRRILSEICKTCNKGFATKVGLNEHIINNHFAKFYCEMTGCSSVLSCKSKYKFHLKKIHKEDDQVLIESLLSKLEKLKPNYQKFKYV